MNKGSLELSRSWQHVREKLHTSCNLTHCCRICKVARCLENLSKEFNLVNSSAGLNTPSILLSLNTFSNTVCLTKWYLMSMWLTLLFITWFLARWSALWLSQWRLISCCDNPISVISLFNPIASFIASTTATFSPSVNDKNNALLKSWSPTYAAIVKSEKHT